MPAPITYSTSQDSKVITIAAPQSTTTVINVFGSGDNYAAPALEFGTDETIMVAGTVHATNGANLTGVIMDIHLDGTHIASTALYGYDGTYNYYQVSLGVLAAGNHTVQATFPRTRE